MRDVDVSNVFIICGSPFSVLDAGCRLVHFYEFLYSIACSGCGPYSNVV